MSLFQNYTSRAVVLVLTFAVVLLLVGGPACSPWSQTMTDDAAPEEEVKSQDETPDPDEPPIVDPKDEENVECLTEITSVPEGSNCTCEYPPGSCDASEMICTCDLACYGADNCLINCTCNDDMCTTVSCTTNDSFIGDCQSLQCTQPNDIDPDFVCEATECVIEPEIILVEPTIVPVVEEQELLREVKEAGMLVMIDPSESMTDNQANLACAIGAFTEVVDAAGAEFSMGVSVMNPQKLYDQRGDIDPTGVPDLVGVSGCAVVPSCSSSDCNDEHDPASCQGHFTDNGAPVTSSDANATDTLKQLFVQDENREESSFGSGIGDDESGLEYAFRYVMELVKNGRGDEIGQVLAVSDEAADGDGACCTIQSRRYEPQNLSIIQAALGTDFNPPANTGNCQTDLINFYTYFFNRYDIEVNVLANLEERDPVYLEVAVATGGAVGNILDCDSYATFWSEVGGSTAEISTQLCLDEAIDPDTLTLIYTEGGIEQTVPRSATDGWVYSPDSKCINLNGSWADVFGSFHAEYQSPTDTQPTPEVCLPEGTEPALSTLVLKTPSGEVVPQSATDGWTFDEQSDCFYLHGSWADHAGPFQVEYNGNN